MTTKIVAAHLWRNDITGLRALAVLPVLLYHAFPSLLPGGFFGVDVFFVISGYLISGIIFRGLIKGNFSYRVFYEKRIKRIIPNLLLLLVFVSAFGYFYLLPTEYRNLGQHIYSSAAFVENFRLLSEVGYFTEDALRKPLLHLWSLAIEEQFYIVFPIICALIWKFSHSTKFIGSIVLLIAVGSLAGCLLTKDDSFRFYFPLTRFWEIGVGIMLAYAENYLSFRSKQSSISLRHAVSFIGLGLIVVPMVVYTPDMAHPGWITFLPVFGAVSLIAANADAYINRTLLSWRPMTFIGLISYSLYLWHWPLLAFLFICIPDALPQHKVVALAISFAVATAVYFLVEKPVRRSNTVFNIPTAAVLAVTLCLAFSFGKLLKTEDGFHDRAISQKFSVASAIRAPSEWSAYEKAEKLDYEGGGHIAVASTSSFPSIIFAGDSHAAQYFERAKYLSNRSGKNVGFVAVAGCNVLRNSDIKDDRCKWQQNTVAKLISDKRVKTIVIAQMWFNVHYGKNGAEINEFIAEVSKRKDLKIFVLLDYPWTHIDWRIQSDFDPLKHVNRINFNAESAVVNLPKQDDWTRGNEEITRLLGSIATIIDVAPQVCPDKKCNLLKWYRDDDHLQPLRLKEEATWLDPIFK